MQRIFDDLTEPPDHLALDEALLMAAEEGESTEAFRVWEFDQPVVVAGRATRIENEILREHCEATHIPVLRRCTGGAAVVAGPGCLMYSVVLSFTRHPEIKRIDVAHQFVMERVRRALRNQVPACQHQGTCDLTWQNRKCSGNSLRIARRHLLYHGTILYDFDLELIAACLAEAPRQPEYRMGRDHGSFVTNVPIDPTTLANDLTAVFEVTGQSNAASLDGRIRQLRQQRYDADPWNFRH